MKISQDPKGMEHWRWCHSIEQSKLYNRFFENILVQSLTPLAASISEIINVEHENRCKIAGFEKFKMKISQEPKGLEHWRWCHSIEQSKLNNRFFEKNLNFFKIFWKKLKILFKKSIVEFKLLYRTHYRQCSSPLGSWDIFIVNFSKPAILHLFSSSTFVISEMEAARRVKLCIKIFSKNRL